MTIPVSTVPQAIAYLLTAIQTQLSTDSLPIMLTLGDPTLTYLPNDIVKIAGVQRTVNPDTFVGSGGQFWLEEQYHIDIICASWTGSAETLVVTERVWQLNAYVEAAIRTDPSLGGLVNIAYPSGGTSPGPEWTGDPVGPRVEITNPIMVEVLN